MIGQWLLTPCLIVLLLLMIATVWQIGNLIVEFFIEHRKLTADIPKLLKCIHTDGADNKLSLIQESKLLRRQKEAIVKLIEAKGIPKASLTALAQRLLAAEEERYERVTAKTDMVAKLGPMFGLLGTLIPLGPGVLALGNGDTATLSNSLAVAFDTTIAGVICAAICYVISNIRKRWYESYMISMETLMECILEEVAKDA